MRNSRSSATFPPPVMEARRWIEGVTFAPERPLINVSQAAPVDPPPLALREAMADAVLTQDAAHLYGPVLGSFELREALAARSQTIYDGQINAQNVAITSGCNQAFSAVITALCGEGDEVILPTPWYFNHKMWLDMAGVRSIPLATGQDLLPDPERAASLIGDKTRAIALVSPNNPGGVEYPAPLLERFANVAKRAGIKLILDETYRDFHSLTGPPHTLFQDPNWADTLVHLYSFSKAYRLTGHRVGAIIAHPELLSEVEKFLDTVAICPSQVGQFGALWGLQNLQTWLHEERAEILARRAAIENNFPTLAERGWALKGVGAYFAYVEHPFETPADKLAKELVHSAAVLCLPGPMFHPAGSETANSELRIAFANIDAAGIETLFDRLAAL